MVKYPRYSPTWPRGAQEVKAPRFLDTRHHEGGKIVAPTYRPPLPPEIFWYSFLYAKSSPDTWTCRILRKKKIPSDMTGDRSGDFPTEKRIALTTTLPQAHIIEYQYIIRIICNYL
jgi:hypothetical protein